MQAHPLEAFTPCSWPTAKNLTLLPLFSPTQLVVAIPSSPFHTSSPFSHPSSLKGCRSFNISSFHSFTTRVSIDCLHSLTQCRFTFTFTFTTFSTARLSDHSLHSFVFATPTPTIPTHRPSNSSNNIVNTTTTTRQQYYLINARLHTHARAHDSHN